MTLYLAREQLPSGPGYNHKSRSSTYEGKGLWNMSKMSLTFILLFIYIYLFLVFGQVVSVNNGFGFLQPYTEKDQAYYNQRDGICISALS